MKKLNYTIMIVLVMFGVLSRTILHLGPNIEFITAISLVSGYLFSNSRFAIAIPLLIMIITDSIIGNTIIFIFTWSGFLFPFLLGRLLNSKLFKAKLHEPLKLLLGVEMAGIFSTLFFYIWTNFGCWLTTNMYTKDLPGLLACYINAIPFLKPQLGANLVIVPIFVMAIILSYHSLSKHSLRGFHLTTWS